MAAVTSTFWTSTAIAYASARISLEITPAAEYEMTNAWIPISAIGLTALVAALMVIFAIRLIRHRGTRGAGVAILAVGLSGAAIGAVCGLVTSVFIWGHLGMDAAAGAICGFAWPSALLAAFYGKDQTGSPGSGVGVRAQLSSGLLRAFAVLAFLLTLPGLFGVVIGVWQLAQGENALLSIAAGLLLMALPASIGYGLWRLGKPRAPTARRS